MELLVKRAKKGDAEAFITLIEENKQSMYKVAKGFLRNEEDIADAMAQTVLDCYEKIGTLKQSSYFKTWMIRILINNCKDMIRKRKEPLSVPNEVLLYEMTKDVKKEKTQKKENSRMADRKIKDWNESEEE